MWYQALSTTKVVKNWWRCLFTFVLNELDVGDDFQNSDDEAIREALPEVTANRGEDEVRIVSVFQL